MVMPMEKKPIPRRFAPAAAKNARSRSNLQVTVRYIARIASQKAKQAVHFTQAGITGLKKEIFPGRTVSIESPPEESQNLLQEKIHFFRVVRSGLNCSDQIKLHLKQRHHSSLDKSRIFGIITCTYKKSARYKATQI